MLRMSVQQMETIIKTYKQLSRIPSVVGAQLSKSGTKVTSQWSVRNLDKGNTTKFSRSCTLNDKLNILAESEFGADITNELLSAVSPSERLRAVIREHGDGKDKKTFLEVWSPHSLLRSVDLKAVDAHGDVYADSEFKTLEWSPDESALVYVAERKPVKSEPFIKRKGATVAGGEEALGTGEKPATQGEEHVYRQHWGEQLVGKHLSAVVLFTLDDEVIRVLPGVPVSCCPGQVKWSPDGKSVVGVAWETEPRRLGLIFCTNRPSHIFSLTLQGQYREISGSGLAVRSPRFVGARLVWLQRRAGGPHHACHQLVAIEWPAVEKATVTTLVDVVQEEERTADGRPFYGVYCQALPVRCAVAGGRLVLSTQQRTAVRSYVLHMESKRLVEISDVDYAGSLTVLDVQDDVIVASRSSLTQPSQLVVGRLPPGGADARVEWRALTTAWELPAALSVAVVDHMLLEHQNLDSCRRFSALYVGAAGDSAGGVRRPLVLHPHGGPHSAFVDAYSFDTALFVSLGFACLLVNYRGSTGSGQKSVDFIMKNIGTADVIDCKMAADEAVKQYPISAQNIVLFGGSHGGFLVTHLSGQYPDSFRSVVSRNPVIDISSMYNSTDIPDWCAIEAGFEFLEAGAVSEEQLVAMRLRSPLSHAHRVRVPTALMLGSKDLRVPHHQGLEYYHRLKANGCLTQVFLYDDNHSLSSVAVEMDNLINSVLWFKQHAAQD